MWLPQKIDVRVERRCTIHKIDSEIESSQCGDKAFASVDRIGSTTVIVSTKVKV